MQARFTPSTSRPRELRVLIVDDVAEVRQELQRLLPLLAPVEVVGQAADGFDALQMAATLTPDSIIMDLEMPVLDGYEAARWIKQACPGCRIVALTIHAGAVERRKAALAGIDAFVVKGAPLDVLVQAIFGESLK